MSCDSARASESDGFESVQFSNFGFKMLTRNSTLVPTEYIENCAGVSGTPCTTVKVILSN